MQKILLGNLLDKSDSQYRRNKDNDNLIHIIWFNHIWTWEDLWNSLKYSDKSGCFDNKELDSVAHIPLTNRMHNTQARLHMMIYIFCQ